MKRIPLILLLCISCLVGYSQVIRVTFEGTGDANRVDWVTATNLSTHESVTFPGSATLRLIFIQPIASGIPEESEPAGAVSGLVYPNPFEGNATVRLNVPHSQTVLLAVRNLSGQLIAENRRYVEAGENNFSVTLPAAGIYFVTMATSEGMSSMKAICTGPGASEGIIRHLGVTAGSSQQAPGTGLKGLETFYSLMIDRNDVIIYRCSTNKLVSYLTDQPRVNTRYKVIFAACCDRNRISYPVVSIGNQVWMETNLAWLPSVQNSATGSVRGKNYYVYGYDGRNVTRAKSTKAFREYGVLYNWEAARTACPPGWKLPTDADWKKMENYLGMDIVEADAIGWRYTGTVGGKLKEPGTLHWQGPNVKATNITGFTALPGGIRQMPMPDVVDDGGFKSGNNEDDIMFYGNFGNLGSCGFFWTSSAMNTERALARRFGCLEGAVERATVNKSLGLSVRCIKELPTR